jgi:hypothetical protein
MKTSAPFNMLTDISGFLVNNTPFLAVRRLMQ